MDNSVGEIDFETFVKNAENVVVGTHDVTPREPVTTDSEIAKKIKEKMMIKHRGSVSVPSKVLIKESPLHNQGVFASIDILIGETIEVAPLLQLGWRYQYHSDPILKKYLWINNECNCKDCKINSPIVYIPLGYGSVYNHSDTPNVDVTADWINQTVTFKAKETILAGSELLINYGENYWKNINDKKK
jgi:hypothetical protein